MIWSSAVGAVPALVNRLGEGPSQRRDVEAPRVVGSGDDGPLPDVFDSSDAVGVLLLAARRLTPRRVVVLTTIVPPGGSAVVIAPEVRLDVNAAMTIWVMTMKAVEIATARPVEM